MIKKNILYIIVTLILSFCILGFTSPNEERKNVIIKRDSLNVNINVKASTPKTEENFNKKLLEYLQSNIELNNSKEAFIDHITTYETDKYDSIPEKVSQLCNWYKIKNTALIKKARNDVILNFWASVIMILLVCLIISKLIFKSIKDNTDWKIVLILSLVVIIGTYLLSPHIQYISSYLFNKDFIVLQKLINIIK